jgi:hypothetical protein
MSSSYIPAALKQLVFDRARGLCEYCRSQSRYAVDPFVMDHIQPVSRGGVSQAENLGAFHFGPLTHPVGAIPPWLPRTLGDRSKVKCSRSFSDERILFPFQGKVPTPFVQIVKSLKT